MPSDSSGKKKSFRNASLQSSVPDELRVDFAFNASRLITLVVGPQKKKFEIRENILRYIPYFDNCLKHEFKESKECIFELPEENPGAVQAALTWLVRGFPKYDEAMATVRLYEATPGSKMSLHRLEASFVSDYFLELGGGCLFRLADKWGAKDLELAACRMIFTLMNTWLEHWYISFWLADIFGELADTRYRYLAIDALIRDGNDWQDEEDFFTSWNNTGLDCGRDNRLCQDLVQYQGLKWFVAKTGIMEPDRIIDMVVDNDTTVENFAQIQLFLHF